MRAKCVIYDGGEWLKIRYGVISKLLCKEENTSKLKNEWNGYIKRECNGKTVGLWEGQCKLHDRGRRVRIMIERLKLFFFALCYNHSMSDMIGMWDSEWYMCMYECIFVWVGDVWLSMTGYICDL